MPANAREAQGRGPDIGIAPGDLGTLQAFVNTLDIELGKDELASPADLDAWLRRAGLADGPADPSGPRELSVAIELREGLRAVLRTHVTPRSAAGNRRQPAASPILDAGAGDRRAAAAAARVATVAAAMRAEIDVDPNGRVVVVPVGAGARAGLTRL